MNAKMLSFFKTRLTSFNISIDIGRCSSNTLTDKMFVKGVWQLKVGF